LNTELPDNTREYRRQAHRCRVAMTSGSMYSPIPRADGSHGDAACAACSSQVLDEAVTAGAGRVETLELGHRYGHLSPLVAVA
jgi:hypothetical protein